MSNAQSHGIVAAGYDPRTSAGGISDYQQGKMVQSAPPPSELDSEVFKLGDVLAALESATDCLQQRLGRIVRPIPQESHPAEKVSGMGLSPLGGDLRQFSDRVEAVRHRLTQLTEALAV